MRQVMPHRNNIVVVARSCKRFLSSFADEAADFLPGQRMGPTPGCSFETILLIISIVYNDIADKAAIPAVI
jgi:hypothetical protein